MTEDEINELARLNPECPVGWIREAHGIPRDRCECRGAGTCWECVEVVEVKREIAQGEA